MLSDPDYSIREIIDYDPEAGKFVWRTRPGVRGGKRAGSKNSHGYIKIKLHHVDLAAHRLAWLWMKGEWPEDEIDHINGDRADNRWVNLRLATRRENTVNAKVPRHNELGLKGVTRNKGTINRYRARIAYRGKQYSLGSFGTAEAAHDAYCAASLRLNGEFANPG